MEGIFIMERSNLTETIQGDIIEFRKDYETTEVKGELAELVDRQLESRGVNQYSFDEKELKRTRERELLGPKFYKGVLEECGLDFWMVFKYAVHHLCDEVDKKNQRKHPAGVEKLFTILTGEGDFTTASRRFFIEAYPVNPVRRSASIFEANSSFVKSKFPIESLKEYFAFELTDDKLRKLEITMENADAMKPERFKRFDQFAERQNGNMEKIRRLMNSMGDEAKPMIFPLLLNELRVNPSDVFRYFYHKDLANSMVQYGDAATNYRRIEILPLHTSENFELFLKMTGVISYYDIFSKTPSRMNFKFWNELPQAMKVHLSEDERGYDGGFYFRGLDGGHDTDLMNHIIYGGENGKIRERFYKGHFVESPRYLISSYGAEATKDRLDAIFTPEVLEIIYRDYRQFTFEPERRAVEKAMKQLRTLSGTAEEKPAKKGLFGLFRK